MIKFKADRKDGPLIMFGLSKMNIKKLQQDQPIIINLEDIGLKGHVCIFAGDTEESMMQELKDKGLLPAAKASGTAN